MRYRAEYLQLRFFSAPGHNKALSDTQFLHLPDKRNGAKTQRTDALANISRVGVLSLSNKEMTIQGKGPVDQVDPSLIQAERGAAADAQT